MLDPAEGGIVLRTGDVWYEVDPDVSPVEAVSNVVCPAMLEADERSALLFVL